MKTKIPLTAARYFALGLAVATIALALAPRLAAGKTKSRVSAWAVQVEPIEAEEGKIPPDFGMAIYENVIAELVKVNRFHHVYRNGDRTATADPNLLMVYMTLKNFQKGSETTRAVTTVGGITKIEVHLRVATRDSTPVIERDVEGTVALMGENLKATSNLAKEISWIVRDAKLPKTMKKASN